MELHRSVYSMSVLFYLLLLPGEQCITRGLEQRGRSAGWSTQTLMCFWHSGSPSVCSIGGAETDRCPERWRAWQQAELLIRRDRLAEALALCKYPSGLRKAEEESRGGRGKRMDLQPYMDKALLFPGFGTLTPGLVPDVAQTAPWCHQEVQLL